MADVQYKVVFQFTTGLPWRQLSQGERDSADEIAHGIVAKWKAQGIERIAVVHTPSTEYTSTQIYQLQSAEQYRQMSEDLRNASELMKHVEKFVLALGW